NTPWMVVGSTLLLNASSTPAWPAKPLKLPRLKFLPCDQTTATTVSWLVAARPVPQEGAVVVMLPPMYEVQTRRSLGTSADAPPKLYLMPVLGEDGGVVNV